LDEHAQGLAWTRLFLGQKRFDVVGGAFGQADNNTVLGHCVHISINVQSETIRAPNPCQTRRNRAKRQTPSSEHQKSSKSHAPRQRPRGQNWDLALEISLVFGAWCLELWFRSL